MLTAITILLGQIALYCGGMWLFLFYASFRLMRALKKAGQPIEEHREHFDSNERYTFHLGLCFILAIGFLGLILAIGG